VATFSWISLVFAFTTGAVPDVLSKLNEDKKKEKQVDLYINYLFPILANGTFIFSSLAGFVIRRYGFRPVFAGAYMGAQLLLGFLLIKNIPAQIGSFLFLSFAQACLYSLNGSYTCKFD
jgi:hypothetical protein